MQRLRWLAARLEWALRPRGKRRVAVLLAGWALIVGWQVLFAQAAPKLDTKYGNHHAIGMTNDREFLFFLRHLGLYPLKSRAPIRADTKEEAQRLLREHPDQLVMEEGHAFRMGERGQIYVYLPDSILRGTSLAASPVTGNGGAFTLALCALFAAFWWDRRPLLGALLVAVIGSDPFQLNEAYQRPNVFSWAITATTFLLAAHVPLLRGRLTPRLTWIVPIASGIFLAGVRTLRSEPLPLAASVVAVYLFALPALPRARRLVMSATFVAALVLAGQGWNAYFKHKFDQAAAAVTAAGGTPYTGPFVLYHPIWHNLSLGLSDFDRKHGWTWNDKQAYRYGVEGLRNQYHMEVPPFAPNGFFLQSSYDGHGRYPVLTEELPHYYDVIRDRVVGEIVHDPGWYLGILVRRVGRILTETVPFQLGLGRQAIRLPWSFLPVLPLIALCLATRRRFLSALLLFALPLSTTPLLVFSGLGATHSQIAHLVGAALLLAAVLQGGWLVLRRRLRAARVAA
jgi:hypothetical protein